MSSDNVTIAVVEDDDIMRQLIGDMLASAGVGEENVLSFADGAEALAFFEREPDTEAIVICDVTMPNLGGFELYDKVHDMAPGLNFIFITAFHLDRSQRNFLERQGLGLLRKPFTLNQLVAAVQDLSDGALGSAAG